MEGLGHSSLLEQRGHAADVSSACFVAGGSQVVSASMDGTLRWGWLDPEDLAQAADKFAEHLGISEIAEKTDR